MMWHYFKEKIPENKIDALKKKIIDLLYYKY